MALYEGNNMRGMMQSTYGESRMDKSRELNASMSIDTSRTEDRYGRQVHSLNKTTYTNERQ